MRGWLVRSKENSGEYRIAVLRAATGPTAAIEHPKADSFFPKPPKRALPWFTKQQRSHHGTALVELTRNLYSGTCWESSL